MKTRINNIEFRTTKDFNGNEYDEIIMWYPNNYYKSETRLKEEGWVFDAEGNAKNGIFTVTSGMFKSPEHCYVIATIEWNSAHDEYDIKSVGRRAFDLKDNERRDFMKILDLLDMDIKERFD